MGLRVGGELDPEPALALGDDLLVGAVVVGGLVEEHGAEVCELEGVRGEVDGASRGVDGGPVVARAGGGVGEDGGGAGVDGAVGAEEERRSLAVFPFYFLFDIKIDQKMLSSFYLLKKS